MLEWIWPARHRFPPPGLCNNQLATHRFPGTESDSLIEHLLCTQQISDTEEVLVFSKLNNPEEKRH